MKITAYQSLCILRFAITFLPQIGYIHPDEYFQGPEVVYGDILGLKVHQPWEFTCLNPIRCIVFPYFVTGICSFIINCLQLTNFYQTKSFAYLIVLLPRLVMCCISFLHDFYLYKMCIMMKMNPKLCLNLFASSYVTLIYFTKTFSNSLEALFFTHALFLIIDFFSIHKFFTLYKLSDLHLKKALFNSFLFGINFSFGCFNRPTFICFALYPCFVWIKLLYGMNLNFKYKIDMLVSLALGILCSAISLTVLDSFYYNKVHYSTYLSHETWKFVCTPLNFILYNTNEQHLNAHGLHPKWLHILVNIPMLFSVYGILFVIFSFKYLFKTKQILHFKYLAFLVLSFVIPLLFLSFVPHQEPRFIIPLIIPMSISASSLIKKFTSKTFFNGLWCITNILGLVFYGFLHQAGVYLSLSCIQTLLSNNTAIIFSNTYMPPRHLLAIGEKEKYINVFDFAGNDKESLELGITKILKELKPQNILLILPCEKSYKVTDFSVLTNSNYTLINRQQIFPHVSTENLPSFKKIRKILTNNSSIVSQIHSLQELFSIEVLLFKNV